MSDQVKYITLSTDKFETEVIKSDIPVVVDFWAAWCGPCRVMNPIIENLATELEGVAKVAKVNIDDHGTLATNYGIEAIPTILIFQNGEVIHRISGIISQAALQDKIEVLTNRVSAV
ncbi:MAG: thioredoxin [Xenococcaceae cyanobacterium MO_167.B27]|nr:thioredoxin [Xenococcaceae cyanobacterium MO_167.B27]